MFMDFSALAYRYRWLLTAIGFMIVLLAIVFYVCTRLGYDLWGWFVWGKLIVHLKLDTNGVFFWKSLLFLFTVSYSLFGCYALWLWMVSLVLIVGAALWVLIEIAFVLHGWLVVLRYMFEVGVVVGVLVGVFIGWIVHELPVLLAVWICWFDFGRFGSRLATHVGIWGTVVVFAVIVGLLLLVVYW